MLFSRGWYAVLCKDKGRISVSRKRADGDAPSNAPFTKICGDPTTVELSAKKKKSINYDIKARKNCEKEENIQSTALPCDVSLVIFDDSVGGGFHCNDYQW